MGTTFGRPVGSVLSISLMFIRYFIFENTKFSNLFLDFMFKHGFSEKRSLPRQVHLDNVKSRPPLSPEIRHKKNAKSELKNIPKRDQKVAGSQMKTRQMEFYSQDSVLALKEEFDRMSSSLASWDEDDFEKDTSRRVEIMLQELDAALYEGAPLSNKHLQTECSEWASKFPYLRVIGKQIVSPKRDYGYSAYRVSTGNSPGRKPMDLESADPNRLQVIGTRLKPALLDIESQAAMEEMLAQDGHYEELLAVDSSADEAGTSTYKNEVGSFDRASTSDDLTGNELADCLLEALWPEVEEAYHRTNMANESIISSKKQQRAVFIPKYPPGASSRFHLGTLPKTGKRIASTALAAYDRKHSSLGKVDVATPGSRTAPAAIRGTVLHYAPHDGPVRRNVKPVKLPPIDATTIPVLPNMPKAQGQHNKIAEYMTRINESSVTCDDSMELGLHDTVLPSQLSKMLPLPQPTSYQSSYNVTFLDSNKDIKSNGKTFANSDKDEHIQSDKRRTISNVVQESLIIQGFKQRDIYK